MSRKIFPKFCGQLIDDHHHGKWQGRRETFTLVIQRESLVNCGKPILVQTDFCLEMFSSGVG
jgi:hypothetical protein